MTKNLDRVVSIISLLIGLVSIAMGIYLSKPDSNVNIVSLSGWIASAVITICISSTAYRTLEKIESDLVKAQESSIKYKDDLFAVQNDLITYRNISASLSSVIDPAPIRDTIRAKLSSAAYTANPQEQEARGKNEN